MQLWKFKSLSRFIRLHSILNVRPKWIWKEYDRSSSLQLSTFINDLLKPIESDQVRYEMIQLGLHEALINAVKHGNLNDQSKKLRVRRVITDNWIIWQIKDEGKGTPISFRRCSLPEKLEAESGRGIYIIHQCFDDVRWSKKGSRLQIACKKKK